MSVIKFKNLLDRDMILKSCNEIYGYDHRLSDYKVYLRHANKSDRFNDGISSHSTFSDAYDFLKENPELEVRDDFFGNNFPFLYGAHHFHYENGNHLHHQTKTITIRHLKVFESISRDIIENNSDFNPSHDSNAPYLDFLISSHKAGLTVSTFGLSCFTSVTYDDLLKKLNILEVMSI